MIANVRTTVQGTTLSTGSTASDATLPATVPVRQQQLVKAKIPPHGEAAPKAGVAPAADFRVVGVGQKPGVATPGVGDLATLPTFRLL